MQYNVDLTIVSVGRVTDIDDLVQYSAIARNLKAEYETLDIEVPVWLVNKINQIKREVAQRQSDRLHEQLEMAKLKQERYKTREEKRAALQEEIDALTAKVSAVGGATK